MSDLLTNCYYRKDGKFCWGGYLHHSAEPHDPVIAQDEQGEIPGQRVNCPVCNGKAVIPTIEGEKLLRFLEIFSPELQARR